MSVKKMAANVLRPSPSISATPRLQTAFQPQKQTGLDDHLHYEGLSAAGSIVSCRDAACQAIFTLRGKPLNVCNLNRDALYKNIEL